MNSAQISPQNVTSPPPRKPQVRLARKSEKMDPELVKSTLERLENAIEEIHSRNPGQLSFEELYRSAYNLVMDKHGLDLYNRVQEKLEEHLHHEKEKLRAILTDSYFLSTLAELWTDHLRSMVMIRDVLMYVDRTWVPQQEGCLSVYEAGNALFLKVIVQDVELSKTIVQLVLDNLASYRRGELVDLSPIRSCYRMLVELGGRSVNPRGVVEEMFEAPFLRSTEEFYSQVSLQTLDHSTASAYLHFANEKLKEELKICLTNFPEMETKLTKTCQKELISRHAKNILEMPNSGFISMVKEEKVEDLHLLFVLFEKAIGSSGLTDASDMFEKYILEIGTNILQTPIESLTTDTGDGPATVSASQLAVHVVTHLMNEKKKIDAIVLNSFNNHKFFQKALKEAFETFMNQDVKCAHYLAIYVDELLSGKVPESKGDVDAMLDKVIGLFRFLSDKDVFESYYKQHLSKRLLAQKSISQDFERAMITKLKSECGHQYTSKLEGMFKDMALSQDASNKFREAHSQQSLGNIDFSVSVLTSGFWPASVHYQDEQSVSLPVELDVLKRKFETFYLQSHSGRTLFWNYTLGSCEVKVQGFDSGIHEFIVSPLQCIILLTFNNGKLKQSFADITRQTGIPLEDLKRHLISLAVPKFQLLFKTGAKREFLDEDAYTFNREYKSKLRKVKIPLVSMNTPSLSSVNQVSSLDDLAALPPQVIEARRHMMEATIVRIMKARKKLDHNNLVSEVYKHLKFRPSPQDLKKRIESLIERE